MTGASRKRERTAAFLVPIFCESLLVLTGCSKRVSEASTAAGTGAAPAPEATAANLDASEAGGSDPRYPSHVAALAWEVKVHQEPSLQSPMIGYLRAGAVVQAGAKPVTKEGCSGGWYETAPGGFVCVEANVATSEIGVPIVGGLSRRPDLSARFPYMYGLVRQHSPIYSRLPTRAEAVHSEYALAKHMAHWLRAKDGASFRADYWMRDKSETPADARELWDNRANRDVPRWLEAGAQPPGNLSGIIVGRRLVIAHSLEHQGFAFLDTAVSEGRRYAITTDLLVVPVDRLRPIEGSNYHGVRIPDEIDVPFALIRRAGAWTYELRGDAMAPGEHGPRRAAIKLTGKEQLVGERRYYETAEGRWLWEASASRVDKFKRMTKWGYDGEHWNEDSIANQTLVVYDGPKPVYATLVSTGEAGLD